MQDAFAVALRKWTGDGLPPNPGAWITTTARNRAIDRLRRESRGRELLSEDALMTMPPERMRVAGARAIGDFFGSVPQAGRLDEIRLLPTSANRQPALAAYARGDDGTHRPYGLMVLEIEGNLIAGIVGFPDPWLFEQCGLLAELT